MKRLMTIGCMVLLISSCTTPSGAGISDNDTVMMDGSPEKILKGLNRSDFNGYKTNFKLTTTNRGDSWHDKYHVENAAASVDVDLIGKGDSGITMTGLDVVRSIAGANEGFDLKPVFKDAIPDFCKAISKSPVPSAWCLRQLSSPKSDTTIDGWRYSLTANAKIISLSVDRH